MKKILLGIIMFLFIGLNQTFAIDTVGLTTHYEFSGDIIDSGTNGRVLDKAGSTYGFGADKDGNSSSALLLNISNTGPATNSDPIGDKYYINGATYTSFIRFKASTLAGNQMIYQKFGLQRVQVYMYNNGTLQIFNGFNHTTIGGFVQVGEWYSIATVANGTTTSVYINGLLVDSGTYTQSSSGSDNLSLGSDLAGGSNFVGNIDDMVIYDGRALNATEILTLHEGTPAGPAYSLLTFPETVLDYGLQFHIRDIALVEDPFFNVTSPLFFEITNTGGYLLETSDYNYQTSDTQTLYSHNFGSGAGVYTVTPFISSPTGIERFDDDAVTFELLEINNILDTTSLHNNGNIATATGGITFVDVQGGFFDSTCNVTPLGLITLGIGPYDFLGFHVERVELLENFDCIFGMVNEFIVPLESKSFLGLDGESSYTADFSGMAIDDSFDLDGRSLMFGDVILMLILMVSIYKFVGFEISSGDVSVSETFSKHETSNKPTVLRRTTTQSTKPTTTKFKIKK